MGVIRHALTAVLVGTFILAGGNKVSDQIHPETHEFLCKGFAKYGKNVWHPHLQQGVKAAKQDQHLPMLEKLLMDDGRAPERTYKTLMKNIGFIEIVCAVMLLFGGVADKMASLVLLCIMIGATYTHHVAGEPLIVTSVLAFLITLRAGMKGTPPKGSKAKAK